MYKKLFFILALAFVAVNQEAMAAAGAGGGMAWDGWFTTAVNSITGPVAYAVALFSIFGAGCMLAFGGHEMNAFVKTLIFIIFALAFIISSKAILQDITGQGAEIQVASNADKN